MKIIVIVGCSDTGKGKPITYEPINTAHNSAAWELQQLLPHCIVRQCGEGGRSLAKDVQFSILDDNYQPNQEVFKDVIDFTHNKEAFGRVFQYQLKMEDAEWIFIHSWGVNDSDSRNWDIAKNTFVKSYKKYLELFPEGLHYVTNNAPVFNGGHYEGDPSGAIVQPQKINPLIEQVWEQNEVGRIYYDTVDSEDMTYDNVHHNTKGNKLIAKLIYNEIEENVSYKEQCKYHPYWQERESQIDFATLKDFWAYLPNKISLEEWKAKSAEAQFQMYLDWKSGATPEPPIEPPADYSQKDIVIGLISQALKEAKKL